MEILQSLKVYCAVFLKIQNNFCVIFIHFSSIHDLLPKCVNNMHMFFLHVARALIKYEVLWVLKCLYSFCDVTLVGPGWNSSDCSDCTIVCTIWSLSVSTNHLEQPGRVGRCPRCESRQPLLISRYRTKRTKLYNAEANDRDIYNLYLTGLNHFVESDKSTELCTSELIVFCWFT